MTSHDRPNPNPAKPSAAGAPGARPADGAMSAGRSGVLHALSPRALSPHARRNLALLGALVAPVVVVQALRGVFGPEGLSPASSHAAVVPVEDVPASSRVQERPREATLRGYLMRLDRARPARSPMDSVEAVAEAPTFTPDPAPIVTIARPSGPSVALTLSAVMRSSNGTMAAINGRVYGVGQSIEPGWVIAAINADDLSVTIHGPEGQELVLFRAR